MPSDPKREFAVPNKVFGPMVHYITLSKTMTELYVLDKVERVNYQ